MAFKMKGFPMHKGVSPMRNTKDDPSNDPNYDPSFGAESFKGYDNNSSTTNNDKKEDTDNNEQGANTGDLSNVVPKTTSVETDHKDSKIKTTDGSNLGDGLKDAKNADERKKLMEQAKKDMYANAWQNSGIGHIVEAGKSIGRGIKNIKAKRKAKKANKHAKKHGWKNTSLMNFGGEQSDKDKQKEYLKGKKVVAFKNGKKVVIPPDKVNKLIDTAGGGKNPSDTSSILADKDSNEVTLLFHSDKDSKTAQTGNSTPREELTGKSTQRVLNTLKEDGTLTEEQAEEVLVKRRAYADRIDKVEDEFKTRATNISKKGLEALDNGDIDAKDLIDNFKKTSGAKGNPEKYWNERAVKKYGSDALNDTNKKGKPTSKAKKAKKAKSKK